ncbi:MAG: hypothetical protein ACLFQB_12915 [Chitinispirillaceae bacterium]
MNRARLAVSALLVISAVTLSHAIIGAGVHYGIDLSLDMKPTDALGEKVSVFDGQVELELGDQSTTVSADSLPLLFVTRRNWQRSPFNLGAKVYVDMLPFIDAVELSCNFGMWEYQGALQYIDVTALRNASVEEAQTIQNNPYKSTSYSYASTPMTIDHFDLGYWGVENTPYAKFHLDASVKKKLLAFPPMVNILKLYGGAGLSMHFATPVLSSKLVEEVLADQNITYDELAGMEPGDTDALYQKVVERIIDGLSRPSFGAHLLAGAKFKLPVIPAGLYMDGKIMFPLGSLDPDADLKGIGFLLNAGVSLSI